MEIVSVDYEAGTEYLNDI